MNFLLSMPSVMPTPEVIEAVEGPWSLMGLVVLCACTVFSIWILKVSGDSKKLIAAKEEAEIERAKTRKLERDGQIQEIKKSVEAAHGKASGVGESFDKHKDRHDEQDREIFHRLRTIEDNSIKRSEFTDLQKDVHRIDKTVVEIYSMMKMLFAKN